MWFSRDGDHMKIQVQKNFLVLISSSSLMVLPVSHPCAYAFYQKMHALHLHLISGSQPPSLENRWNFRENISISCSKIQRKRATYLKKDSSQKSCHWLVLVTSELAPAQKSDDFSSNCTHQQLSSCNQDFTWQLIIISILISLPSLLLTPFPFLPCSFQSQILGELLIIIISSSQTGRKFIMVFLCWHSFTLLISWAGSYHHIPTTYHYQQSFLKCYA